MESVPIKSLQQSRPGGSCNGGLASRGSARERAVKLLKEPLVHFLLAAAVLFAMSEVLSRQRSRYRIEIGPGQVELMAKTYALQYGARPDPVQLAALEQDWIRSEIFVREAKALGLDEDDQIIRRRLAQKYEFVQQDLSVAKPPTHADLIGYYRDHTQAYTAPTQLSFEHIFFSVDRGGEERARLRAQAALEQLRATGRGPTGDTFSGPVTFADIDGDGLTRVFGGGDAFIRSVFSARTGVWTGPLRSGLGWHLVRIAGRSDKKIAPFAEVEGRVREDYLAEIKRRSDGESYRRLRARYTVVDLSKGS